MSLTARDKAIIADLKRFRVMSRDDISEIHFKGLKHQKDSCNHVLLRLLRENQIQRSTAFVPYVYFGSDVSMKKNSQKIGHFLAIVGVYKELLKLGELKIFQVEPKYGAKGTAEPDVFAIFRQTPFFIEVQKTLYSEKQMTEKMDRYLDLYNSGIITNEPWQPVNTKIFPHVLILSDQRYAIPGTYPFRILQAPSFTQFLQMLQPTPQPVHNEVKSNLKIKIN
jgi:hypothetical protein